MENLNSTVLSTALPAIAADFGASPIHLKLALTSYLLALAVFIPASGWLADRYGARTIFRLAIAVFTLGSIACGLSSSIPEIVAARVVQGIGGSMMMPVGRLVILRSIPKHELVGSLAWLTIPALHRAGGRPAGRRLHHHLFRVALDLLDQRARRHPRAGPRHALPARHPGRGAAALRRPSASCFTAFGLALFMTGSTTLGLNLIPTGYVLAALFTGAVLLAAYVIRSRRIASPIIDLSLLRIPTLGTSLLGTLLFRIGDRRDALPPAAPPPGRLRHDPVPVRHDHLRLGDRRHRHEVRRPADPPALRLPRGC